jgi:hypothetical protein
MGTEEFWVPAVMAAVGTGAQAINTSNANKRQQNATVQGIDNQATIRGQAMRDVNNQTNKIAQSSPNDIANKETGDFVNSLRKNVGGTTGTASTSPSNFGAPTSALGPTPGASSRYSKDSAAAAAQTQSYGTAQAGEVGAVDSAINQRKNEASGMQSLTARMNLLNAQSSKQAFLDNMRATQVGQGSPWVSMFANMMKGLGSSASKNGWFSNSAATPTADNPYSSLTPGFFNPPTASKIPSYGNNPAFAGP